MTTRCRAAALTAALLANATMAFPAIIRAQTRGAAPTRACAVLTIAEIKQIAGTRIQDVMYAFPPMETPLSGRAGDLL